MNGGRQAGAVVCARVLLLEGHYVVNDSPQPHAPLELGLMKTNSDLQGGGEAWSVGIGWGRRPQQTSTREENRVVSKLIISAASG